MDWKNHLISPQCHALAQQFLPLSGEAFLTTFANKGLYKRACKDLAAVTDAALAEADGALTVTLDGVTVTLRENLAESACSCPSKTVCKHIVMAVLCAAEAATACAPESGAPPPSEQPQPAAPQEKPYAALNAADPAALRKQAGKRAFDDALRLLQDGWGVAFTEGEMLSAHVEAEDVTVFFPPQDSVARAVCKCGAPSLCRHKLAAILAYLGQTGPQRQPKAAPDAAFAALLAQADRFVSDLLLKGLSCAGETDAEAAVQLSLHLESRAGNLARAFRRLSADIESMLAKNAAFQPAQSFALLSRLHNTLILLLRRPGDTALTGRLLESGRSEYHAVPAGRFLGLGAYPWRTKSGYFGITALLWHEEKQRLCTYTSGMAGFYEKTAALSDAESLREQLHRPTHWADSVSLADISSHRLSLRGPRLNGQYRLSSGKQTACALEAPTCLADVEPLPIAADPDKPPLPEPYAYFPQKRPEQAALVFAASLEQAAFDRVDQTLRFAFCDGGRLLPGELPYSELTEKAIAALERLARLESFSRRCFVCLQRGGSLTPVSVITGGGVENFYF